MELFNKSNIEKEIKELPNGILNTLLDAAISININSIAIVGGVVRDLLTKSKNEDYEITFNDLDLIIEGDPTNYIKELQNILGPDKIKVVRNNTNYRTSEITINDIKIDIASARSETYPNPGENPIVELSTIRNDLIRRDFTINAMAIELNTNKLIDLFSGLDAISNSRIDFLHEFSVLEDPTRIIRAARYAAKLDFHLSNNALIQIQNTIKSWPWNWQIGDKPDCAPSALSIRLKMELELLFESKDWEDAIKNLQEWGALKIIDSKLQKDKRIREKISIAKNSDIEPLAAFIYESQDPIYLAERLKLSQRQKEIIKGGLNLNKYLNTIKSSQIYKNWSPSMWTNFLEGININEYSFRLEICRNNTFKQYLSSWLYNWRYIESPIKGDDLIAKGWTSGPELGEEIKRQRMNLIDEQNTK